MKFLEQDLEDMIWDACQTQDGSNGLSSRGLHFKFGKTYRQFNFGGGYGIADLINVRIETEEDSEREHRIMCFDIYELKKDEINFNALSQACRYIKGCERIREQIYNGRNNKWSHRFLFNVFLVGKSIDEKSDFVFVADTMPNVHLYTYSFDAFKGLVFKEKSGYRPGSNLEMNRIHVSKSDIRDMLKTDFDDRFMFSCFS